MENKKVESAVTKAAAKTSKSAKKPVATGELSKTESPKKTTSFNRKPMADRKTFGKKPVNSPKDTARIREAIEQRINQFFEQNKETDSIKLVSAGKLMDAGCHNGLRSSLWNPKMKPFIYYRKSANFHTIDILKTLVYLNRAYSFIHDITKQGGRVMFVSTKNKTISDRVVEEAKRTASFYVNKRWLGGTLTNFKTITNSINKLNNLTTLQASENFTKYNKKERLEMTREAEKLNSLIGGIRTMRSLPQVIVVTDPISEHTAMAEAKKLKIPVVAIATTNANPDGIDFIIPANNNNPRSVDLLISILADAVAEAREEPTKVVGKKDEEIVLLETNRQPIVDHMNSNQKTTSDGTLSASENAKEVE